MKSKNGKRMNGDIFLCLPAQVKERKEPADPRSLREVRDRLYGRTLIDGFRMLSMSDGAL